jgi:hypothetical protein
MPITELKAAPETGAPPALHRRVAAKIRLDGGP